MKQKNNPKYKKKHLFKSDYCLTCQQRKSCGVLNPKKKYCCPCYRKILEELEWDRLLVDSAQQLLNDYRQRVIECFCLESEKSRVRYLNSDGSGWSECERCERLINSAGHHGVIKNRNNPNFWGIGSIYKILCLECIGRNYLNELSSSKRKTYWKYKRRGYV